MGVKTRSAKGVVVDFDLLKIKEQIASAPPPMDVQGRQDFIEKRLRRKLKKAIIQPAVVDSAPVKVEPSVPSTDDDEPAKSIESKSVVEEPTPKKATKQRARKKVQKEDDE